MKRALVIIILVLLSTSGLVFAEATSDGNTATDAVNKIFAEPTVEPATPIIPASSVATETPQVVSALPATTTTTTTTPTTPTTTTVAPAGNFAVDTTALTLDETVFERNSLGEYYVSAHHEVEPWVTISARVAFPKLSVGINPNITNGIFSLSYDETPSGGGSPIRHQANINVSNVTKDGYIDLIGLSGMEQQFSASPELDLTFWNWLTFSWTQLKGSGAATTPLSVSVDGAANVTVMATAQTDLTMDMIGLQFLNWGFLRTNYIDLNLLAGVQLFWPEQFNYNYSLPIPNMTQTVWQGNGKAPFPIGTPYYGLGADIQLGNFTFSGSYAGLAGLDSLVANYTDVALNYYIINADLNYAFTKNISIDAGYRLFNLQPTIQNGFKEKWMPNQDLYGNNIIGYSTLLRAEGPYGGITVRF